jgi:hypothetical protein
LFLIFSEFGILSLEFKYFYSSVAGAAVSAAGLQSLFSATDYFSAAGALSAAGATFQLHLFLCQNLYQKVLQQLQLLLKLKFYRLI